MWANQTQKQKIKRVDTENQVSHLFRTMSHRSKPFRIVSVQTLESGAESTLVLFGTVNLAEWQELSEMIKREAPKQRLAVPQRPSVAHGVTVFIGNEHAWMKAQAFDSTLTSPFTDDPNALSVQYSSVTALAKKMNIPARLLLQAFYRARRKNSKVEHVDWCGLRIAYTNPERIYSKS